MRLDGVPDPREALERVDVLRVAPEELPLVLQHAHERVRSRWLVAAGEHLLREEAEGPRVVPEVGEVEDALGRRQVVLLQLGVEPGAGRPEVRDAGRPMLALLLFLPCFLLSPKKIKHQV